MALIPFQNHEAGAYMYPALGLYSKITDLKSISEADTSGWYANLQIGTCEGAAAHEWYANLQVGTWKRSGHEKERKHIPFPKNPCPISVFLQRYPACEANFVRCVKLELATPVDWYANLQIGTCESAAAHEKGKTFHSPKTSVHYL